MVPIGSSVVLDQWQAVDAGAKRGRIRSGREIVLPLRRFAGGTAHRAVHTGAMPLHEHSHDLPCLALHLLGRYGEFNEGGDVEISGPAAVLHAAGAAHREAFSEGGAEVIILKFDPAWLNAVGWSGRLDRSRNWLSGPIVGRARALAAAWMDRRLAEPDLARLTARFLDAALEEKPRAPPPWLAQAREALDEPDLPTAPQLARQCERNRAWIARSYRAAVGEGLRETVRRRRVERAIELLRDTSLPPVEVALSAGFCDQSHMNRALRALTGRTPLEIRAEGVG